MTRILLFIILLGLWQFEINAKELNQFEKLSIAYAEVIGDIALGNVAFSIMNERCKTTFENSSEFLLETDYYLRKNTGYTFDEFIEFMGYETETENFANQLVNEVIQQNGGCNTVPLEHWAKFVKNHNEENNLNFLRQNDILFGLPKIIRSELEIKQAFKNKLKGYKHLPYQELFDLASALEHGSYSYSMFGLSQSLTIDKSKAIELWKYSIEKFNNPEAYYYIGLLLQKSSRADAFDAFEQSAKQGYKYGELWLGTYYACNKDSLKAEYWLNIAKEDAKDPDYIDDIYAEIDELGMPTNCMNGWVY